MSSLHIAERIEFAPFVEFLERLQKAPSIPRKTAILRAYYASFCDFQRQFCASNAIEIAAAAAANNSSQLDRISFFPLLRLLAPAMDSERPACGIQPRTMGRLLVRVLAVDARSKVAQRLMRRDDGGGGGGDFVAAGEPAEGGGAAAREDYADVVFAVMRTRASTNVKGARTFTVAAVNEKLDRIAALYQENRREREWKI